ncbi:hypothetical protein A3D88_02750 [Candidatus Peribacteria bacterium RIFCSPHIGHO2_02_FULL_52_16]|nr:MAG: hypothetical protein A2706_00575 [Candidatus Peribacteria bacterium RIFCSPHIGHO2_01_FULL_51_35]OGJ61678.1 MAG: hypothetical protein A3D88_02750 [Candidatus Peribacteria bacterium RIFCSPHIGHO2_02_FULL_52_16]
MHEDLLPIIRLHEELLRMHPTLLGVQQQVMRLLQEPNDTNVLVALRVYLSSINGIMKRIISNPKAAPASGDP